MALSKLFPEALLDEIQTITLQRNDKLFELKQSVENIYFVESGEIDAIRFLPNGAMAVMQRSIAGELFAEAALCVDPFTCEGIASKPSTVFLITKANLMQHLETNAVFARQYILSLTMNIRKP